MVGSWPFQGFADIVDEKWIAAGDEVAAGNNASDGLAIEVAEDGTVEEVDLREAHPSLR